MTKSATSKTGTKNKPVIISPEELQRRIEAADAGDRPIDIYVTQAKIVNNRLNVGYDRSFIKDDELTGEPIEVIKSGTEKGINMVHQDMKVALALLKSHLLILCDIVEAVGKSPDDLDKNIELLGHVAIMEFKCEGSGDNAGVTIVGTMINKRGKKRLLISPFEKFFDIENPYQYREELEMVVNHCQSEARNYYNGKIAPSAPTLFDQDDEMNDNEKPLTEDDHKEDI